MRAKIFAVLLLVTASSQVRADFAEPPFTCTSTTKDQTATLRYDGKGMHVEVSYASDPEMDLVSDITFTDYVWDGHSQGLLTAKGASLVFQDGFGRVNNATVTAFLHLKKYVGTGWILQLTFDSCRMVE